MTMLCVICGKKICLHTYVYLLVYQANQHSIKKILLFAYIINNLILTIKQNLFDEQFL